MTKKEKQFRVRISIGVDGEHPSQDVTRYYGGDYDTMHNKDWNETMQDFLDDAKKYTEEAL